MPDSPTDGFQWAFDPNRIKADKEAGRFPATLSRFDRTVESMKKRVVPTLKPLRGSKPNIPL